MVAELSVLSRTADGVFREDREQKGNGASSWRDWQWRYWAMTGCQYHSKQDTYYLISTNLKLPYWKTVSEGFTKAAAEYGVTARIDGPDSYDAQAELTAFQKAVVNKPAGILISVADAALLRPEINSAIEAGIPVITVDSDAPTSERLYFIGTNNLEAGHLGGQRLLEKLHEKGNVVFYTIAGQPNLVDRLAGYEHAGRRILGSRSWTCSMPRATAGSAVRPDEAVP